MLEDIHWADSTSLQFIYQLHTETSDHLLMILATARPDFFARYPQWMQEGTDAFGHLRLEPLNEESGRELIRHILHRVEQIPEKLFSTIIQRAEGNPYHIEEFIKLLIADNVIILGKTNWNIRSDKLVNVRVPTTLINILQARIDQLPPNVRQVIRCASIMGYQFWDEAIAYMLDDSHSSDSHSSDSHSDVQQMVDDALAYLLENKIISEAETESTNGEREFVFNNTLLHQVVYEGILKRERRVLHKAVGRWLAEQAEDDLHKEDVPKQKLIQNEPMIAAKV